MILSLFLSIFLFSAFFILIAYISKSPALLWIGATLFFIMSMTLLFDGVQAKEILSVQPELVEEMFYQECRLIDYRPFASLGGEHTFLVDCNITKLNLDLKTEISPSNLSSKVENLITKEDYDLVTKIDSKIDLPPNELEITTKYWTETDLKGSVHFFISGSWIRDRDDFVDYIPIVTIGGVEIPLKAWIPWFPSISSLDNPPNPTTILTPGIYFANATIQDSNLNTVSLIIEYQNGTDISQFEMIGHNETVSPTNETFAGGVTVIDGRVAYGGDGFVFPNTSSEYILDTSNVNKWWSRNVGDCINGECIYCYRPNIGNCSETLAGIITYKFLSPICDLWIFNARGSHAINGANFSFDNYVTYWNDLTSDDAGVWYLADEDVSGTLRADGYYNYTMYFKRIHNFMATFDEYRQTWIGGLKCVPKTNTESGQFYTEFDTSDIGEGSYFARLNITNSTWDENLTIFSNLYIDFGAPFIERNSPLSYVSPIGYIELNPPHNYSCFDLGTGVSSLVYEVSGCGFNVYNSTTSLVGDFYLNLTHNLVNCDLLTETAYCIDNAGLMNSTTTTYSLRTYGLTQDQENTLNKIDLVYIHALKEMMNTDYICLDNNTLEISDTFDVDGTETRVAINETCAYGCVTVTGEYGNSAFCREARPIFVEAIGVIFLVVFMILLVKGAFWFQDQKQEDQGGEF